MRFLKTLVEKGDGWVEITLPILTVSESNGGRKKVIKAFGMTKYKAEHWSEKGKRHLRQKGQIYLILRPMRKLLTLPCEITFTRYATNKLDKFDNLPMSFKWILDAICEVITGDYVAGRADATIEDEIDVKYRQVISEDYGIKIRIEKLDKT